ncbi:MAG: hypothetical protein U9R39_04765, partial [Campylobacterota bacterium]|nr:hypothetical protein [Campylobacterota bacterium]
SEEVVASEEVVYDETFSMEEDTFDISFENISDDTTIDTEQYDMSTTNIDISDVMDMSGTNVSIEFFEPAEVESLDVEITPVEASNTPDVSSDIVGNDMSVNLDEVQILIDTHVQVDQS